MIVCYYQWHKLRNIAKQHLFPCPSLVLTYITHDYTQLSNTDQYQLFMCYQYWYNRKAQYTNTITDTCISGILFSTNLNICCFKVLFSNSVAFFLATSITLVTIVNEIIIIIIIIMIECTELVIVLTVSVLVLNEYIFIDH